MTADASVDDKLNLRWGAEAIGAEIHLNERQTFHILPTLERAGVALKINGRWVADTKALRRMFRPTVVP